MRSRSTAAIAFGLAALVASWAFGSMPLVVVGLGFILAALASRGWARLMGGSTELERRLVPDERVEGNDLVFEVRANRRRRLGGTIVLVQQLGGIEQQSRLVRSRSTLVFSQLPRGRHKVGPLVVTMTDPLGLERVTQVIDEPAEVLVRPRVPVLSSVFSSQGARDAGAARSRFRRPSGFEIHAIRDYAPGEPLRAVHWPSTARRGSLMVKELEDAPRDDLAVILDQDTEGVAGPVGQSSFDAAVRAAGALVLVHALWNRKVVLLGTAPRCATVRVRSSGPDWELALDALAAIEPVAGAHVELALAVPAAVVARAREIVVVSARPERAVEPLLELRRGGRAVSLVVVASETYTGRPRRRAGPWELRAAAHGISVRVVSAESTIEEALAGRLEAVAGG